MTRHLRNTAIFSVAIMMGSMIAAAQSAQPGAAQTGASPAASAATNLVPVDQQATKEQLTKLFEVMRLKEQMQSMHQLAPSMVKEQIASAEADARTELTPEQREGMQKVMNKYVGKAMDLYPTDEMLRDMGAIYQKHLSKQDVEGLIVFYSSPAGQHLMDAQPVIAQEIISVVTGKLTERSQAMIKEMMQEWAPFVPSKPEPSKPANVKPPAE
jgi:uncharacterized protein